MVERFRVSDSGTSSTRRSFLRAAGATLPVAPVGTLDGSSDSDSGSSSGGGSGSSSDSGGYETIEVDAGEREVVEIADGGTLEDVLFDVTADGASVFFNANGNGWTMRNVGVRGVNSSDDPLMHASVPDPDAEATLENVYFGDGTTDGGGVGVWVDATGNDAHRGSLVFESVHVARFASNGIYASGPGYQMGPDEGGAVHVRNSFGRNNNVAQFRLGTNGSTVENSLALVDGEVPSYDGWVNARGMWLREEATDVAVERSTTAIRRDDEPKAVEASELQHGILEKSVVDGPVRGEENLEFHDVEREAEEEPEPPESVPTSAEEAADG